MKEGFTKETVVVAGEDQVSAPLAEKASADVVVLDLKNGLYYELTNVGARIWELLQSPNTVGAILDTLLEEFEVEREECEADLLALLEETAKRGLVEVREPSDP